MTSIPALPASTPSDMLPSVVLLTVPYDILPSVVLSLPPVYVPPPASAVTLLKSIVSPTGESAVPPKYSIAPSMPSGTSETAIIISSILVVLFIYFSNIQQ